MSKMFASEKPAVLVANGFNEADLTTMQRRFQPMGAVFRMVSVETGLVNSWRETDWGLSHAADANLASALSTDYTMLFIPGGFRSMDKLRLTAHTKRFISGFIDTGKPVIAMGEAGGVVCATGKIAGYTVCGPQSGKAEIESQGAQWAGDEAVFAMDRNLFTCAPLTADNRDVIMDALADFMAGYAESLKQAA